MRYLWAGIAMFARDRSLWPFAAKPMVIGALLYLAVFVVAIMVTVAASDAIVGSMGGSGWMVTVGRVVGLLLLTLVAVFASGLIYLTFASIASAYLWEGLSAEIERRLGIDPPMHRHAVTTLILDGCIRFGLMAFVGIVSFIAGWFCAGLPAVVGAGMLGLLDYTSPSYLRRNEPIWIQAGKVWSLPGAAGFGFGAGLLSLLPFVNLLLLPGLVAGGTMLRAQQFPHNQKS